MKTTQQLLYQIGCQATKIGFKHLHLALDLSLSMDTFPYRGLTTCLYPEVAKQCKTTSSAISRPIARTTEDLWQHGNRALLEEIAGRKLPQKPQPSELLYYLDAYCRERIKS